MEFCPKCGAILMMKKTKAGCPRCNYTAKGKVDMKIKEIVSEQEPIAVIDEKQANVNPITDWECKKCGKQESVFLDKTNEGRRRSRVKILSVRKV